MIYPHYRPGGRDLYSQYSDSWCYDDTMRILVYAADGLLISWRPLFIYVSWHVDMHTDATNISVPVFTYFLNVNMPWSHETKSFVRLTL